MKTTRLLLALPLALGSLALGSGAALAQATTTTTQSTVTTPIPGVLSTERTERNIGPTGVQSETNQTTYRHSDGTVTTDTKKSVTAPLMPAPTTVIVR